MKNNHRKAKNVKQFIQKATHARETACVLIDKSRKMNPSQ